MAITQSEGIKRMGNVNEKDFILLDQKYGTGVCIDRFKNEYSICLARKTAAGDIWKLWGFPQGKDKEPVGKSIPWRITFGFREQAIQYLEKLIFMIEGRSTSGY
jgi:hypothetical protein